MAVTTKQSGFALFNYWYQMYSNHVETPQVSLRSIPDRSKVLFNQKMLVLKGKGMSNDDIKDLMLFAVWHNPLNIPLEYYGDVNNVIKSHRYYVEWLEDHTYPTRKSRRRAIMDTAAKVSVKIDDEYLEEMERMYASFD